MTGLVMYFKGCAVARGLFGEDDIEVGVYQAEDIGTATEPPEGVKVATRGEVYTIDEREMTPVWMMYGVGQAQNGSPDSVVTISLQYEVHRIIDELYGVYTLEYSTSDESEPRIHAYISGRSVHVSDVYVSVTSELLRRLQDDPLVNADDLDEDCTIVDEGLTAKLRSAMQTPELAIDLLVQRALEYVGQPATQQLPQEADAAYAAPVDGDDALRRLQEVFLGHLSRTGTLEEY